jgi:hypothetical protein
MAEPDLPYTEYTLYSTVLPTQHHVVRTSHPLPGSQLTFATVPGPQMITDPNLSQTTKKKKKALLLSREENEEKDPGHRFEISSPSGVFLGQPESQTSNYVFFSFAENGFRVLPCSKWYRLSQKPKYATLTLEEAEESLSKRSAMRGMKGQDRWMMHKKKLQPVIMIVF